MTPSTGCPRDFLVTFLQLGHPAFMFVLEDICLSIAFYYHSFTDASLIYSLRRSDERIVLNGRVVKLKPAQGTATAIFLCLIRFDSTNSRNSFEVNAVPRSVTTSVGFPNVAKIFLNIPSTSRVDVDLTAFNQPLGTDTVMSPLRNDSWSH
ncbi:uncharacterized protein LOC105431074 isoform X2 [Pogonomyrmex barbatus]|uniref:Uncharacterized protein LOC105431074 isoform X2 n=1 Tax=Pogonomyrmex barbatus TaxID=144034 RepID=A0A6I9WKD1_9HYME|nr:uncharacterized protein LOC105431074 isoform X2 [Pogonomyrmex barbatus]